MRSLSKILLQVDFSERSLGAARYAKTLAGHFHSELTLLLKLAGTEAKRVAVERDPARQIAEYTHADNTGAGSGADAIPEYLVRGRSRRVARRWSGPRRCRGNSARGSRWCTRWPPRRRPGRRKNAGGRWNWRLGTIWRVLQQRLGTEAEPVVEAGDPPKVVCEMAQRQPAGLLVIGRGSAAGVFGRLRANAYAIIRQSPCPVVSV